MQLVTKEITGIEKKALDYLEEDVEANFEKLVEAQLASRTAKVYNDACARYAKVVEEGTEEEKAALPFFTDRGAMIGWFLGLPDVKSAKVRKAEADLEKAEGEKQNFEDAIAAVTATLEAIEATQPDGSVEEAEKAEKIANEEANLVELNGHLDAVNLKIAEFEAIIAA